jgi:MFS family permease
VYVQNILGLTPLQSGLLLLPGSLVMGIMSPITGRLFDKYGVRWLAIIGLTITIATTFLLSRLTMETSFWYLTGVYTVRSLGLSMLMMPVMTAGLNALPLRLNPHGTAMSNTVNAIGGAIGTALFVSIMSARSAVHTEEIIRRQGLNPADPEQMRWATLEGMTKGTDDAFLVATLFTVCALIFALFLKDENNASPDEARREKSLPQPSFSGKS